MEKTLSRKFDTTAGILAVGCTFMRDNNRSRPLAIKSVSPFSEQFAIILNSSPTKAASSNQKAFCTGATHFRIDSGLEIKSALKPPVYPTTSS